MEAAGLRSSAQLFPPCCLHGTGKQGKLRTGGAGHRAEGKQLSTAANLTTHINGSWRWHQSLSEHKPKHFYQVWWLGKSNFTRLDGPAFSPSLFFPPYVLQAQSAEGAQRRTTLGPHSVPLPAGLKAPQHCDTQYEQRIPGNGRGQMHTNVELLPSFLQPTETSQWFMFRQPHGHQNCQSCRFPPSGGSSTQWHHCTTRQGADLNTSVYSALTPSS